MTLDEAIKHCEEVAEENEKFCFKKGGKGGYFNEDTDWNNRKCAKEHRQLAAWLTELKQLREQVSCSEEPNKWIPISERVPKENGYYLTTTMLGEVYCDYWNEIAFDRTETVIAWMPLPTSYQAESEE